MVAMGIAMLSHPWQSGAFRGDETVAPALLHLLGIKLFRDYLFKNVGEREIVDVEECRARTAERCIGQLAEWAVI